MIKIPLKAGHPRAASGFVGGPTLNASLVFHGIRSSIAKRPYIFCDFYWGQDPLSPLWIRT